jgi:hypothetical protein
LDTVWKASDTTSKVIERLGLLTKARDGTMEPDVGRQPSDNFQLAATASWADLIHTIRQTLAGISFHEVRDAINNVATECSMSDHRSPQYPLVSCRYCPIMPGS